MTNSIISNFQIKLDTLSTAISKSVSQPFDKRLAFLKEKHNDLLALKTDYKNAEKRVIEYLGGPSETYTALQQEIEKVSSLWKENYSKCQEEQIAYLNNKSKALIQNQDANRLKKMQENLSHLFSDPLLNEEQKNKIHEILATIQQNPIQPPKKEITEIKTRETKIYTVGNLSVFPKDILMKISSYCAPEDLCSLASVCKDFKTISEDDQSWELPLKRLGHSLKTKQAYKIFIPDHQLVSCVEKGLYQSAYLSGHFKNIHCLCKKDQFVYTGSNDRSIKIWDLTTCECIATLTDHNDGILCLLTDENYLYSGSLDGTIKIWNLKDRKCIATLTDLENTNLKRTEKQIRCLCKDEDLLYTAGPNDGKVKIWDLVTHTCLGFLQTDSPATIHCLIKAGSLLYASSDQGIAIWDLSTNTYLGTLNKEPVKISHFIIKGQSLYACSEKEIKIWDLKTKECVATFNHGFDTASPLTLQGLHQEGNLLFTLGGTLKIWDLTTKKELTAFHSSSFDENPPAINCFIKEDNMLFYGMQNRFVIVDLIPSYSPLFWVIDNIHDMDLFQASVNCKKAVYSELETITMQDGRGASKYELSSAVTRMLAIYRVLIKEILQLLQNGHERQALKLFKKLPDKIKFLIYDQLKPHFKNDRNRKDFYPFIESVFCNFKDKVIDNQLRLKVLTWFLTNKNKAQNLENCIIS